MEAVKQILLSRMRRFISSKPHAAVLIPRDVFGMREVWRGGRNSTLTESKTYVSYGRVVGRKGGWSTTQREVHPVR
jgi:hypothetical protein